MNQVREPSTEGGKCGVVRGSGKVHDGKFKEFEGGVVAG